MNDSQIERLLNQMSLAQPSSKLDNRIAACLAANDSTPASARPRQSVFSSPVVAAIALSLVVGIIVGRSTATPDAPRPEEKTTLNDVGTTHDEEPAADQRQVAQADIFRSLKDHPETILTELKTVPEVAMLCALRSPAPSDDRDRCLSCHTGLSDAQDVFRREHTWQLKSESCGICHDMTNKQFSVEPPDSGTPQVKAELPASNRRSSRSTLPALVSSISPHSTLQLFAQVYRR